MDTGVVGVVGNVHGNPGLLSRRCSEVVDCHGNRHGRKVLATDQPPKPTPKPRGPQISRLLTLAIRFKTLVRSGEVADYAEIARLGLVTRARMTQIMSLLNRAPDIQEELVFLPGAEKKQSVITERSLRPIVAEVDWRAQRVKWNRLRRDAS